MLSVIELAKKLDEASFDGILTFLNKVNQEFPGVCNVHHWNIPACAARLRRKNNPNEICGAAADPDTLRCRKHKNSYLHQKKYVRKRDRQNLDLREALAPLEDSDASDYTLHVCPCSPPE